VRTLRATADLLSAADSIDGLRVLARAMGFDQPPSPLDDDARRALGLDDELQEAYVAAGVGTTRALLLVVPNGQALRELLPRLASRLSARAPHVLWMVMATQPSRQTLALAAWGDDRRPPRVAALVADRARLVDSDAETFRALSAAASEQDVLTHARWVDILGREALTVRFYRALEAAVERIAASSSDGTPAVRREIALLNSSRLLFLSFLEAKGWLDGDPAFLARQFDRCMTTGGRFHTRVLRPLFFGTLNTAIRQRSPVALRFGNVPFLNGGLFARTPVERQRRELTFSDDAYGTLIADVFGQYRFTAREESTTWTEAAVDPEMLGRAFESLMAAPERRRTGAFFTPFALVDRVATAGLDAVLRHRPGMAALETLTVLDPACGSGAFLVHVLERIASLLIEHGDPRDTSAVRRDVVTRSIFGVDVNPTAVWLCELRLWLSVVIESVETDPASVMPLPNLDRNVRAGDALAGHGFGDADGRSHGGTLRRLRQRYAGASGPRKSALGRELDRAERTRAIAAIDAELATTRALRRDLLIARRGRDLFGERYRPSHPERVGADELRRQSAALRQVRRRILGGGALPFSFGVHFADVASRGGFSLVVGNPPWVRLHNIPVAQRREFRRSYDVARGAAWEPGAGPSGAGRGFAGQVDVAALFVERAVQLLSPNAVLALLLPVKLWQSLAGGGVRRLLDASAQLEQLEDHSGAHRAFDAAVYPSLIVARKRACVAPDTPRASHDLTVTVHHHSGLPFSWPERSSALPFDGSPGAPWIFLPPDARRAFDRLQRRSVPLASSRIGRPHLGVKCGCNEAFVVQLLAESGDFAEVMTADGKRMTIERALLRPLLRGEHLRRWCAPPTPERIIWTHDLHGDVLPSLPAHAARWFGRWRRRLDARTDARGSGRWWSLFRTESARCDRTRVVWGDLGREPRASVLEAGDATTPLNSCYVVRCEESGDAHAFAALLNGAVARAWLGAVAEPARGGYYRYLGWTLSLLPVPLDWTRARSILAPLGERARCGVPVSDSELLNASLDAYGVAHRTVAPLLAWQAR
jgi:hypothetical protein